MQYQYIAKQTGDENKENHQLRVVVIVFVQYNISKSRSKNYHSPELREDLRVSYY